MTTLCVFGFVLKDEVVFLDVAPVVAGFVSSRDGREWCKSAGQKTGTLLARFVDSCPPRMEGAVVQAPSFLYSTSLYDK